MALPLGKLTILVGAGIVGSVLAKEGRLPGVPDLFSGAFKIALKQIGQNDSTKSTSKPHNDSLLQQVKSLQQELQLLASSRPITIVTSCGSGSSRYTIIIVVVVMGYGYVWWKGWKLPELMFATRRSLSDACENVSKQLESVYTSISATKRHLTSQIDCVDSKIDECVDYTAATRDEVKEIRGNMGAFSKDVQSVRHVVQSLETKISRIEGRQDETNFGVGRLVGFVRNLETKRAKEQIEASPSNSSRSVLELPPATPLTRTGSLLPNSSVEPPTPSASSVSPKRPLHGVVSASGLKELEGISDVVELSNENSPPGSNAVFTSEQRHNENSTSSFFGRTFSGIFTRSGLASIEKVESIIKRIEPDYTM